VIEVHPVDRFELRYTDFSLDDDQAATRDVFRDFFTKECPTTVVRAAEPLGHDEKLWNRLKDLGVTSMGLPADAGGDGGSLVDLVLVAEEYGAVLAPVPLISQVVAGRLLAAADAPGDLMAGVISGDRPIVVAPQAGSGQRQLVPDAALARDVVMLDRESLVLASLPAASPHVPNQGGTPLAWFDPATAARQMLCQGSAAAALHARAMREWRLLTAAALVAMTDSALRIAVEFAKTRQTMGVPIGSLQGVAFPLADIAINVGTTRNLVRKAAWMAEYDPDARPDLIPMAFATAARIATAGTTTAAHLQGGLGYTVEADASLFFLRAKGRGVLAGDPNDDYRAVGDLLAADTARPTARNSDEVRACRT
jgi:alkylation response protein AidB-like acyl-CoA dehydrogenase